MIAEYKSGQIRQPVRVARPILMDLLDTTFHLVCTALALYFTWVRFRARMPLFGHAMLATAILEFVFFLEGLDLAAYISAAAFIALYMKSWNILQEHGLSDGSWS
jgi:cell division protein FtsW (lipid II flippase)